MRKKVLVFESSKCIGCRICESWCSISHFGVINPAKSCIKITRDHEKQLDYATICHQCPGAPVLNPASLTHWKKVKKPARLWWTRNNVPVAGNALKNALMPRHPCTPQMIISLFAISAAESLIVSNTVLSRLSSLWNLEKRTGCIGQLLLKKHWPNPKIVNGLGEQIWVSMVVSQEKFCVSIFQIMRSKPKTCSNIS